MTHEEDCLGGICDCDNPILISRPVTPHDELLLEISSEYPHNKAIQALYEVAELHKPFMGNTLELCKECNQARRIDDPVITYPCRTIQAIKKELA